MLRERKRKGKTKRAGKMRTQIGIKVQSSIQVRIKEEDSSGIHNSTITKEDKDKEDGFQKMLETVRRRVIAVEEQIMPRTSASPTLEARTTMPRRLRTGTSRRRRHSSRRKEEQ